MIVTAEVPEGRKYLTMKEDVFGGMKQCVVKAESRFVFEREFNFYRVKNVATGKYMFMDNG